LIPLPHGRSQLIVFGGIFLNPASITKPSKALNDLYILDISKLAWVMPTGGNDALVDGIHVMGPSAIYGHVAIAVKAVVTHFELMTRNVDTNSGRYDMLVYGGSTNVNKAAAGAQHGLFQLNTEQHSWTKAQTGYLFPPERVGHSLTVCTGWSPFYNYPSKPISVASAVKAEENSLGASDCAVDTLRSCAVIFSGQSCLPRPAEIWCLDLTPGRRSGVNQFDYCVSNLIDNSFANTRSTNQAILTLRKSTDKVPRHCVKSNSSNFSTLGSATLPSPLSSPSKLSAANATAIFDSIDITILAPLLRIAPLPSGQTSPGHKSRSGKVAHDFESDPAENADSISNHDATMNSVLVGFQGLQRLARTGGHSGMGSRPPTARSNVSLSLIPEEQQAASDSDIGENDMSDVDYYVDNNNNTYSEDDQDRLRRLSSNLSNISFDSLRLVIDPQQDLELSATTSSNTASNAGGATATSPHRSGKQSATSKLFIENTAGGGSAVQPLPLGSSIPAARRTLSPTANSRPSRLIKQPSGLRKVQIQKPKAVVEREEIGSSFLKCRIQRAMADIDTEVERGQAAILESRCDRLAEEAAALRQSLESMRTNQATEEAALMEAIEASQENVRLLGTINLEAGRLARLFTS
jgi:hypothetical protein